MKFDILFIDHVAMKPYITDTLEGDVLGGTESSTIRLAEGFASKGHKVGILQKFDFLPTTSKGGVMYLPNRWLSRVQANNVIHLRSIALLPQFHEKAKQFVWFHDLGQPFVKDWIQLFDKAPATLIAVSDWHIQNLKSHGLDYPIQRIYSPLDELCYSAPRAEKVDKDQLVWLSSPHKGLPEAINVFYKLQSVNPEFKLAIFNPGYFHLDVQNGNGIRLVDNATRAQLRTVTQNSLCLFYPTQFQETFGLVAAECEALGTPVATYKVAALAESVRDSGWMNSEEHLIECVLSAQAERPIVRGQERFRFEEVYKDWKSILA